MAMKIDICKAFDTIRWDFIHSVLFSFCFSSRFISWVSSIFDSARISILINGQPQGYFGCSRGVRQGDPLSPLLFVIAEDFLSRLLTSLNVSGKLNAISSSHNVNAPTHFCLLMMSCYFLRLRCLI